jgi:SAM-dependent methyltransferase
MARATDWDTYYQSVPATAQLTRKYTTSVLLAALNRATPADPAGLAITEIGGANSCFLDSILANIRPRSYDVVDTNAFGLSLLAKRVGDSATVRLHEQSVLQMSLPPTADVVYSVGLVEHFDKQRTREAVLAHFDVVRPGGLVVITFPTPTLLYRMTRGLIEAVGMWKFHDERPLQPEEVLATVRERGEILQEKILWPLMLTQYLVVARKKTLFTP